MTTSPAAAIPTRFTFAFEPRYQRAGRPFGVIPQRTWVDVDEHEIDAHFGRWQLRTPLSNVRAVEITGPYRFLKTAGPARLGVTDLGITFATNHRRGVLLTFHEKVPAIEPLGLLRHPELTVTVAEIEAFAKLVRERAGIS